MWKGLQGYIDRLTGIEAKAGKQGENHKKELSSQEREFLPGGSGAMGMPWPCR